MFDISQLPEITEIPEFDVAEITKGLLPDDIQALFGNLVEETPAPFSVDSLIPKDLPKIELTPPFEFGTQFLGADGIVEEDLARFDFVILYYTGSFADPAVEDLSLMTEYFNQWQTDQESVQLISVSYDEDQEAFNKHREGLPWLHLPLKDPREKSYKTFCMSQVPTVVVFHKGKIICGHGIPVLEQKGAAALEYWKRYLKKPFQFEELEEGSEAPVDKPDAPAESSGTLDGKPEA